MFIFVYFFLKLLPFPQICRSLLNLSTCNVCQCGPFTAAVKNRGGTCGFNYALFFGVTCFLGMVGIGTRLKFLIGEYTSPTHYHYVNKETNIIICVTSE